MKRLQITIDEDVYAALGRQAAEEGVSKGTLNRRYVRERLTPLPPIEEDPLAGLVGAYGGSSADDIDGVVYGAKDP